MTELTEERLQEIEAMAAKATKRFAVYSVTGMHIGIWEDRETAEGVCDCDWFGDFIIELIDAELAEGIPALVAEVRRLRVAIEQSTCPHPILGDETVRDCVNHGHCGCGNLAALKGDDFAIKFHQERMGAQS